MVDVTNPFTKLAVLSTFIFLTVAYSTIRLSVVWLFNNSVHLKILKISFEYLNAEFYYCTIEFTIVSTTTTYRKPALKIIFKVDFYF